MSDEDLKHFINTRPSSYDIHAAIFEHDRRARESADRVSGLRHGQILRWTIMGAIAAITAAAVAVWMLFR